MVAMNLIEYVYFELFSRYFSNSLKFNSTLGIFIFLRETVLHFVLQVLSLNLKDSMV